jgi:hypothetical protein
MRKEILDFRCENIMNDARWIKLKEATRYAAIGKARLISLAVSGVIRGAKDPDSKRKDWIFDRLSIDSYRDSQMTGITIEQKALAILNRERI